MQNGGSQWEFGSGSSWANEMDAADELAPFREEFHIPSLRHIKEQRNESFKGDDKEQVVYLCGNSLGLLPKRAVDYVNRELTKWANIGALGHEHGQLPWVRCEDFGAPHLAKLLGCSADSVAIINNLTSNMHLLLSSFYRPTASRYKIAIEGAAFPSDHYALQNHIRMHGLDEKDALVIFKPRPGEDIIRNEDIAARIEQEGDKLAAIFMSAVHFRTGQFFDLEAITNAGHRVGALVGFDLAHAIGNVPMALDKWGVDFACACSYKYLNSGAGGIGVCYVNRRHFDRQPRLIGWFAHKLETRFVMNNELELDQGAAGFKTGNQSPLLCATLLASLELFTEAGFERLRKKSMLLTSYLEWLITKSGMFDDLDSKSRPKIVTPTDPNQRGAQLSIRISDPPGAASVGDKLESSGAICDIRKPDIVRVAPAPMYNTFSDVYRFAVIFHQVLKSFQ